MITGERKRRLEKAAHAALPVPRNDVVRLGAQDPVRQLIDDANRAYVNKVLLSVLSFQGFSDKQAQRALEVGFGFDHEKTPTKENEMRKNEVFIEAIAIACHEANRRYCKSIGDDSQPDWDDAPDWQKESARAGVRGHLSGEIQSPEQSHEAWLKVKEADGWVYGEVKDSEKKTHPCMMPYADLPAEQKEKDALFTRTVATGNIALMGLMGKLA